jgi:hypothetical protein
VPVLLSDVVLIYFNSIVLLTPLGDFCVVPILHSMSDIAKLLLVKVKEAVFIAIKIYCLLMVTIKRN